MTAEPEKVWSEKAKKYGEVWKSMTIEDILTIIEAKVMKMKASKNYRPLFKEDVADLYNWVKILIKKV